MIALIIVGAVLVWLTGWIVVAKLMYASTEDGFEAVLIGAYWPLWAVGAVVFGPFLALGCLVKWLIER